MQGATTLLEVMAEERPERPDALFKLGNLLRYKEHFAQAVKAYDRAFARLGDPDDADWSMFHYRGIALERSKQWARAEEDLLKALELKPDQPYVLNYLGSSWRSEEHTSELPSLMRTSDAVFWLKKKRKD